MKVTVENKKGLEKDIKVFIDKDTINGQLSKKSMKKLKIMLLLKASDLAKYQKKF